MKNKKTLAQNTRLKPEQLEAFYLEWFNDLITLGAFAEYHRIGKRRALNIVTQGRRIHLNK